uniref:Uncharacterized protein n=1 Tax=Trichogramma kaykai TaxID=54128 RepID=A0ABD2W483_9HYME
MFAKSFFLALPSLLDSRAEHIRLLRWRTIQVLGINAVQGRYQRRLLDSMLSRVPQISSRATNKKYRTMTCAREQSSHLKMVNREISSRAREIAFIAR